MPKKPPTQDEADRAGTLAGNAADGFPEHPSESNDEAKGTAPTDAEHHPELDCVLMRPGWFTPAAVAACHEARQLFARVVRRAD